MYNPNMDRVWTTDNADEDAYWDRQRGKRNRQARRERASLREALRAENRGE